MNKLIIFVLVAATLTLTSCSSTGYSTANDYGDERRIQSYDPYFYGLGFYGPNRYGYGNSYRNGYRNADRYGYGNGYNHYNNRRRPLVIYRSTPPATIRIRPINPKTDRWNPKDEKRGDR